MFASCPSLLLILCHATTKAAPGTTINSGNTLSSDEHPSTKGPDAKVNKGLGPVVDSDNKKAAQHQGKAKHEQIKANPKAVEEALEEKLHKVQMAKECLVQFNVTEEHKGDDLHVLHPQCLSTAIHKRHHMDVESDDKCFDLREADNGSNPDDSSSKSNEATKMKNKSQNKGVKGAAHQELLTRTEDLRSAEHTEET
ncbi:hypothetical protein EDB85DRAFT_1897775 [Lactarius pseudohatsudake]|nr:hypothetical protein EDB85DRAFT_1897775 [Lactarius pseudohatsudake]